MWRKSAALAGYEWECDGCGGVLLTGSGRRPPSWRTVPLAEVGETEGPRKRAHLCAGCGDLVDRHRLAALSSRRGEVASARAIG